MAVIDVKIKEVDSKLKKEKTYPWIGKSIVNNLIVLFSSMRTGVVLHSGATTWKLGKYLTSWDEEQFDAYTDEIVLKMKE